MKSLLKLTALLWCLLPDAGQAAVVLNGKITSKVTGHVVLRNNLFVTDEHGGWYEQALKMDQLGGFDTAYEIDVPLRITSSTGVFQVRMDAPLVLQHQTRPELMFRDTAVKIGPVDKGLQQLVVGNNIRLTNPPSGSEEQDSIGHYLLNITGFPPEGNYKAVTGTYSGVLSLTFEPIVET